MSGEEVDVSDWLIEAAGEDDIDRARHYRNDYGESFFNSSQPLHLATQGGFFNICKFLIEKRGVDVNELNSRGKTPLFIACTWPGLGKERENAKIIKLLLEHGANIWNPNGDDTLLHTAAKLGRKESVNILLDAGVDVDIRAKDGSTPLHVACSGIGTKDVIKILCQNNADVNARDETGWSSLHEAVFWAYWNWKSTGSIETLLKFGSDVNAQGANMEMALHCLCPSEEETATILLDEGCDINVETRSGKIALDTVIARVKQEPNVFPFKEQMIKIFHEIDSDNANDDDDDDDDDFEPDEFPTVVILKQHLVKLKTAKLFVSQKNLSHLDSNDFSEYENQCQEEISAAQNEELLPGITLYDILSGGANPIYPRNKPLMSALKRFNWNSFPLYKSIILNNIKKSKLRCDLLESGEKWLRILLKTSNILNEFPVPAGVMSAEILSMIVSFLSNDELNALVTCGDELRRQLVHKIQKPPAIYQPPAIQQPSKFHQPPKCHQPPKLRKLKRLKMRSKLKWLKMRSKWKWRMMKNQLRYC